jgi:hypothetical protein
MTRGKAALKVLNKQDLADPERTALWLATSTPSPTPAPLRWTPVSARPPSAWPPPAAS